MDGENDAAQSGAAAEIEPTAAPQAGGNAQGAGGVTLQAQEVNGDEEAAGASAATEEAATSQAAEADLTAQIAERDARITELEAQLATQEVDHELQLAGCRSTRAARVLLDDHNGDVAALKEAEPWLFNDASRSQTETSSETAEGGTTGLKPAGTEQSAATVARWERLAGLSDEGKE